MLFREEVISARAARLDGDVDVSMPLPWRIVGGTLFLALLSAIVFLAVVHYARVETVEGRITTDKGIISVRSLRAGIVDQISVAEGQRVSRGEILVRLSSGAALKSGVAPEATTASLMKSQDQLLWLQAQQTAAAAEAQRQGATATIKGLEREIRSLEAQAALQRRLVTEAEQNLELATGIARNGFISKHDLQLRRENLTKREQQLLELEAAIAAKRSAREDAGHDLVAAAANAEAQIAALSASRDELAVRSVTASAEGSFTLKSPVAGLVTALSTRAGQSVPADTQLMAIVPLGGALTAELFVPTRSAGFLRKGQEVRLAVDAFPYQLYGTIPATLESIASSAVDRVGREGRAEAVYLVTASIPRASVVAAGARRPLVPGMTLKARIVIGRQTLLEWLLEPFFAVNRR